MDEGKLLALFRQVVREELGAVNQEGVVSLAEAAKRLDISERTVRRMVRSGELLVTRIGKVPKVPVSEIRRVTTPAMSTLGQPRVPRQQLARLNAASLARRGPKSLDAELAELKELRSKRKR